jgi:hypothetical protein
MYKAIREGFREFTQQLCHRKKLLAVGTASASMPVKSTRRGKSNARDIIKFKRKHPALNYIFLGKGGKSVVTRIGKSLQGLGDLNTIIPLKKFKKNKTIT